MSGPQEQTVFAEGFFSRFADILGPHLSAVGLPPDVLSNPSTLLSVPQFVDVLEVAARERQEDCLGLHLAEKLRMEDLGVLGYATVHAGTLEQFLLTYSRYFAVYAQGVNLGLEVDGNRARFSYQLSDPAILERRQDAEMAIAFVHNVIKKELCDDWRLLEVQFEHSKPTDTSEHRRIFDATLRFGKPANALVFHQKYLTRGLMEADLRLYPVLQSHLDEALVERSDDNDLVARVSGIVAKSLSGAVPRLSSVAEQLGLPTWTLQRRLRDEGLVYSQLVADVRRDVAITYLKKSSLSLSEIAFLLGYSEISAFSRAFRRWSGTSPQAFRVSNPGTVQ